MKILMTGGTGFIGSNLIERLTGQNQIFVLTNSKSDLEKNSENLTYIYQDLTKPLELGQIDNIDCIIHLAQGGQKTIEGASTEFKVNVAATFELLEFARTHGVNKFIYASSGVVYGFVPNKSKETDPMNPINLYGATKIAAEGLIRQYRDYFNCVILRFYFPYGPGTPPNQLFGKLVANIANGEEVQIKNNGEPKITPLYIDDLTEAFLKVIELPRSATMNLAGKEAYSILEIAGKIGKILGKEPKFNKIEEKPNNQNLMGEIGKAETLIDFKPKVSLDDGLKKLIESLNN